MKKFSRAKTLNYLCFLYDIVAGQVSAASSTARWSSRVDSTEHPEFRSYLSGELRNVRVPHRTVNSQEIHHVVQGYLAIFKIPRRPRADLTRIHTLDGTRTGRAICVLDPCVTRADGYRSPVGPNIHLQQQRPLKFPNTQLAKPMKEGTETS